MQSLMLPTDLRELKAPRAFSKVVVQRIVDKALKESTLSRGYRDASGVAVENGHGVGARARAQHKGSPRRDVGDAVIRRQDIDVPRINVNGP